MQQVIDQLQRVYKAIKDLHNYWLNNSTVNPVKSKNVFLEFTTSQKIPSQCSSISFINQGDENIVIEGVFTLAVGDPMLTISNGNADYDTSEYQVRFLGGGVDPKLIVIKRMITGRHSYFNEVTLSSE